MTAVARRAAFVRAVLFALVLVGGACAHDFSADAAAIRVECNIPEATVWIDDLLVGSAKEWKSDGRQIRPGFHRIEIRHPGYYSFFQEVELPPGSRTVVNARLRETLD
jgi:hypothetical protein